MKKLPPLNQANLGLLAAGDLGLNAWRQFQKTGEFSFPKDQSLPKKSGKKRVLVVGWDAADWKIINPLLDRGMMPTLQKMINGGVMGNLRTLDPPYSPMLWTSIATGKRPDKHGILGFVEPNPATGDIRPVQSSSRKCRAFWNILSHKGYKVNMVGWWPSHPAEPIKGAMISNHFPKANSADSEDWPIANETIFPAHLKDELAALRIHPKELTKDHILPFIPNAAKINQEEDLSIAQVSKHLAEAASLQAATTYLMRNTEWDVTAVYFDAIDKLCHRFAQFLPPRMGPIPEEKYHLYKKVVPGIYRFHDMMLEHLINLAGEDTTVVVLSDHGFYTGQHLLAKKPKVSAAISVDHRPQGIFCMQGKNVKKDELIHGASLLDVTPTLLALLGEKVGEDMDGKVLQQCFEKPGKIDKIESWDNVEGDFGEHPAHLKEDPTYTKEALRQLVDLGYIQELEDDAQERLDKVTRDNQINLALAYAHNNRLQPAVEILEKAYTEDKVDSRINLKLIEWYCKLNQPKKAREVFVAFKKFNMDRTVDFDILEAGILLSEKEYEKILTVCDKVLKHQPRHSKAYAFRGVALRNLGSFAEAELVYQTLLKINPENSNRWLNLGICQLKQEDNERAAASILKSVNLDFNQPNAHYQLGKVLNRMELFAEAANALEICLNLNPKFNRARNQLVNIYKEKLNNPAKAKFHQDQFYLTNSDEIVMVSGLPRSGTSMLMQMLKAGGMPLLIDDIRQADENNPKGYFEYEPVKNSQKDTSWLNDAKGKAVKVVVPVIGQIHIENRCKVILMERPIEEIMHSQQRMLQRLYPDRDHNTYNLNLAQRFKKDLENTKVKLNSRGLFEALSLDYEWTVNHPEEAASKIIQFLKYPLDKEAMVKVVHKELHREKITIA